MRLYRLSIAAALVTAFFSSFLPQYATALTLCVHDQNGRVRAADECRRNETAVEIDQVPFLCVHDRNGRVRVDDECRRNETAFELNQAPFETPFFVAMMVGDADIVVGENGPLEAVARCFPSPASGLPRSRLLMRSSVDGWAITQAVDPTRFNLFDLPAGEQAIGGITNSGPELGGALGASAIAPTGEVLTVDGGTVLVAMNILDDYDCVMAGVVTTISSAGGRAPNTFRN